MPHTHRYGPWRRAGVFDSTELRACVDCRWVQRRRPEDLGGSAIDNAFAAVRKTQRERSNAVTQRTSPRRTTRTGATSTREPAND